MNLFKSKCRFGTRCAALLLIAATNGGYSGAALAVDPGNEAADKLLGLTGKPLATQSIVRRLAANLPDWDASILDVGPIPSPVDDIGFTDILNAVNDEADNELPPQGATQMKTRRHALKLVAKKGKIRYVNYERAWQFERDAETEPVKEDIAYELALKTLGQLGIDDSEIGKPDIQIQRAVGAKAGAPRPTDQFDMYRLVRFARQINEIPVYDAGFNIAISNEGQVQRLGLNWPSFELSPERRLRTRRSVIFDAAKRIAEQKVTTQTRIRSSLAYAMLNERTYTPVLVVSVLARPTPFQLLVELTGFDTDDTEQN